MKKYDAFKIIKKWVGREAEANVQEFKEELLVDVVCASIRITGVDKYAITRGFIAAVGPLKEKAIYLSSDYDWHLVAQDACIYLVPTKKER